MWTIHPREPDLSRLHDPISNWSSLNLVERHNTPDTWSITGPPKDMAIFQPGYGSILFNDDDQITTGKVTGIRRVAETDDQGRATDMMVISFASDLMPIGQRIVIPSPSYVMTSTIFNFPDAYDLRSGAIESLIIDFIRSHAGDLAQANRRVYHLRTPTTLGRGGTTQVSGRFDNLGVLVSSLAEAGGLRIRVEHVEETGFWLDLVIDEVEDLSADIRFGTKDSADTGLITDWEYEIGMPNTTRAIVAAGGELGLRDMLYLAATPPETLWGTVAETLIDQRHVAPDSVDKQNELTRAAEEALDEGAGLVKVSFSPMLGPDLRYRRDVRVGDIVGYDLPGLGPAKDKIREATTTVAIRDGVPTEAVSVTVGTKDAPTTRTQQQTARALRAVNVLQRS